MSGQMSILRSIYYWSLALGFTGPVLATLLTRSWFEPPEVYDPWLKRALVRLFKLLNSEPRLIGLETLPQNVPVIYMANHNSLIDIPLLKAVIPTYFRGILAHPQFKYPLYGPAIRRMGNIPIHRKNIRASLGSFKQAGDLLASGVSITVLPEGGRSTDGSLRPFKLLPFKFAKDNGVAIVPISIAGAFAMKNKNSWQLQPGRLTVRFGKTITPVMMSGLEIAELAALTRERILSGLTE